MDLYLTSVLKYNYIAFLELNAYSILVIEVCGWVGTHTCVCPLANLLTLGWSLGYIAWKGTAGES